MSIGFMRRTQLARPGTANRGRVAVLGMAAACSIYGATPADAAVTVYEGRMIAWEDQVGAWETMDFIGVEENVVIPTDFYLDEFGVLMEGGPAWGHLSETAFPIDGSGFGTAGFQPFVDFQFDVPLRAFAADHPGLFQYSLFMGDELIFESDLLGGPFSGLISDAPFDRVRLSDSDGFGADDLRFGLIVPAPAPFAMLLALAGRMRSRRRAIA